MTTCKSRDIFDANVEVERRPTPAENHLNILYVIDPGDRRKVAAVKVEGNRDSDTETIIERMTAQPSSFLLKNGRFSQRLLTGDLASIKYLYQSNGFLDVKVNSDLQESYEGRQGEIAVVIKIEEVRRRWSMHCKLWKIKPTRRIDCSDCRASSEPALQRGQCRNRSR